MSHSQPKQRQVKSRIASYRFWFTKRGRGDQADEGILITDCAMIPKIIGFIDGIGEPARKAMQRIAMGEPVEEWVSWDFRPASVNTTGGFDGNLLYPWTPFGKAAFDPDFAAAMYSIDSGGFVKFSVFNFAALYQLIADQACILRWPELEAAMEPHDVYLQRVARRHAARQRMIESGVRKGIAEASGKALPSVSDPFLYPVLKRTKGK